MPFLNQSEGRSVHYRQSGIWNEVKRHFTVTTQHIKPILRGCLYTALTPWIGKKETSNKPDATNCSQSEQSFGNTGEWGGFYQIGLPAQISTDRFVKYETESNRVSAQSNEDRNWEKRLLCLSKQQSPLLLQKRGETFMCLCELQQGHIHGRDLPLLISIESTTGNWKHEGAGVGGNRPLLGLD